MKELRKYKSIIDKLAECSFNASSPINKAGFLSVVSGIVYSPFDKKRIRKLEKDLEDLEELGLIKIEEKRIIVDKKIMKYVKS